MPAHQPRAEARNRKTSHHWHCQSEDNRLQLTSGFLTRAFLAGEKTAPPAINGQHHTTATYQKSVSGSFPNDQ